MEPEFNHVQEKGPDDGIIRFWRRNDAPYWGQLALEMIDRGYPLDARKMAKNAAHCVIIGHMGGNISDPHPPVFLKPTPNEIADKLFILQEKENNGRGVFCVRSIVDYLRLGKIEDAKTMINTDYDKIRNYPKIVKFLEDNLLD